MTQASLARKIGLSPGRVCCLKKEGMPTHSVKAAQAWRAQHYSEGMGHKGTAGKKQAEEAEAAAAAEAEDPNWNDTPAATLERMREIERRAYKQISRALAKSKASGKPEDAAALSPLIRAYNQAATNSIDAAKAWEKHCRNTGQVAPVEHLVNVLTSRLEPLASRLRAFAATVAPKANPQAPAVAEAAIAADMEALLKQVTAALDPIPPAQAGGSAL
jgi:hypothetical protein